MREVDTMSVSKLIFVLLILSVSPAINFTSSVFAENIDSDTLSAIDGAEVAVASAYKEVLEAEQAGAEVSGLLSRLNVAGEYLANAHISSDLGDLDSASRFANLCIEVGEEVRSEAYQLRVKAYSLHVSEIVLTVTISIVCVIIIIFLSFLGWPAFKRRYIKQALEMKPELVPDES